MKPVLVRFLILLSQTAVPEENTDRTCSQEEDLVVAISSNNLVNNHRCVFVLSVGADHQGSPSHRVDGVEHDWMVPHKVHHVVRELFGCVDVRRESSSRTLEKNKYEH